MKTINIEELVKDGAVHGDIYNEEEIFQLEMTRIFEKTWVFVAHESEIANPGDYKTTVIGEHPLIVTRDSDTEEIFVLFNRCRHRAATVCQQETGNANFFRCAYHGWTYSNNGDLTGMPFQDGYDEHFDRCKMGLIKVPRVGIYQGFIFASLSEEGPSLEEHLGHARPYIDYIVGTGPDGIALNAGAHKYSFDGNWKLQIENTIDPYHLSVTHRSFFNILSKKTGKKINFNRMHKSEKIRDLGNGHSLYELGGDLGIGALPFNLIVFPNLGFLGSQVRVTRPISVNKTHVFLYPIMLKGVSVEENAERLRKHEGFYGPAGFGTVDDLEVGFDRVAEGLKAKGPDGEWLEISRGMNREEVDEQGIITATSSDEVSARALYKEWKRLMTAGSIS
ncbi:aromatic ring-hydroxylating dioxygenase subunit alpha [Peribacillus saganii]|uniref:Aromatic ring-hydroxylating dioxygenase subunit alpha n=1 Tax=Peribacillus saganii TaxID=2303992 RepID=A0A372LQM2_9BACI|nr:Rieske 2Fe-2S domain-containing protein [Peribacillus saganii]RFU70498.1 aromatic ring-hydroxylating dioxygenase subunit alpha [Peribacillus saganii]